MLCSEEGYALRDPFDTRNQAAFGALIAKSKIGAVLLLQIPQKPTDNTLYDSEDRVEHGARLLRTCSR